MALEESDGYYVFDCQNKETECALLVHRFGDLSLLLNVFLRYLTLCYAMLKVYGKHEAVYLSV